MIINVLVPTEIQVRKTIVSMKWKFYGLLLFGVLVIGCNQNKKNNNDSENVIQQFADDYRMEFSFASITEKDLALCEKQRCPEITINYLQAKGDQVSYDNINEEIKNFVIASLHTSVNGIAPKTIKDAAIAFSNRFHEDITEFPDTAAEYSAIIDVNEIYNTSHLVSLELTQYLYTGGAHGNGSTVFLNINPRNGKRLNFKDLIKNEQEFLAFAEKKFRDEHNIPADQPINSTGFWFEDEKFFLPESVGFTIDDLIFIYNDYEISSYAESPVELRIPREEAQRFLKIQ